MFTLAAFTAIIAGAMAAPHNLVGRAVTGGTYTSYTGDGSAGKGWPEESKWISSFDTMWTNNLPMITSSCGAFSVPNTTPDEANQLKDAINQVAQSSGVDARVILAIVMQESKGCVRVWSTNYGVNNPGLMQDHNGKSTCNSGQGKDGALVSAGQVQTPCPQAEILGMIQDGVNGTPDGPGLKELGAASTNSQDIYVAARKYNAGSVPAGGDLGAPGATPSYCSDVANRLMGVVFDSSPFNAAGGSTGGSSTPTTTTAPATSAAPAAPAGGSGSGSCKTTYTVQPGDGCWAIANAKQISLANFYAWNPSVSSDCSNLKAGASVCVSE